LTARPDVSPQKSIATAQAWLACRSAAHICALPLAGVVETMRPLPCEPFPKAPPFVSGIAIVRGVPTPVVDMRALMGEPPATAPERYVTVEVNNRIVALAFDAVLGIHTLDAGHAIGLPPLLRNVAGETISDVAAKDTDLLLFFEAARIFPPGMIEALMAEKEAAG
jgi:purine-binding chemotaxis protein CheW